MAIGTWNRVVADAGPFADDLHPQAIDDRVVVVARLIELTSQNINPGDQVGQCPGESILCAEQLERDSVVIPGRGRRVFNDGIGFTI